MTAPDAGTPLLGLAAAHVARPDGTLDPGTVWLDPVTGMVVDVARGDAGPAGARPGDVPGRVVPLGDRTIAPGFVDVHVHGGAGREVNGPDPTAVEASLHELAAFHARHGTTALLATTVSDSPERLAATVAGVARAARRARADDADRAGGWTGAARVLGVHLEGPFLSPARAGAQDPAWLRPPERAEMDRLLELGDGTVRLVTLAPELPGAGDLIDACLAAGATVALGHTDAGYETARRAFDAGASHVTHLFDAMAPLHHRTPGLATAALLDDAVTVELICDLHHLHPATIELVLRVARARTALVTDATAAAGLAAGRHRLGTRDVVLEGTRVALASDPSVLAGSALTMDLAVRLAVGGAGVPLADALAAACLVPARVAAGQPVGGARPGEASPTGATGTVEPGAPADLCVLDPALEVVATLVGGAVAFDPGHLLS